MTRTEEIMCVFTTVLNTPVFVITSIKVSNFRYISMGFLNGFNCSTFFDLRTASTYTSKSIAADSSAPVKIHFPISMRDSSEKIQFLL